MTKNELHTYNDPSLWKVIYRRGERIFRIQGPLPQGSEAIAIGRQGRDIDHEVAENGQTVQWSLSCHAFKGLERY